MADKRQLNKYIDFKVNGRLFPSWVMANFKKYKLPEIFMKEGQDPCEVKEGKKQLKIYQVFMSIFLDYKSPYQNALLYHGLGAGKTAAAIQIYNMLYNYTPGWNVYVLLKATLKDDPWLKDLEWALDKNDNESRMNNIKFISYDSPTADRQFIEEIRRSDSSKKSLYFIEEAHNFIRNVYTNINSKQGKRAQVIYDYILQDKRDNESTRVILLSGSPSINSPYELALLFNLLRPGSFPKSESEFNKLYVSGGLVPTINPANKNMFQRRIMGLVSYYIGSTPEYFAEKIYHYEDIEMSQYQDEIYTYFEGVEELMARNSKSKGGGQETYKSYTRQSSNFVFPPIRQGVDGESRPRPNKFKLTEKEAELLDEGKQKLKLQISNKSKYTNIEKYKQTCELFINSFDEHLDNKNKEDNKNGKSIFDDFKIYLEKYHGKFNDYVNSPEKKTELFKAMFKSSAKFLAAIFNILQSPGPVLVYSNYVYMEGIEIFKIYLKYFGFSSFNKQDPQSGKSGFRHIEYHGEIDREERKQNLRNFNKKENIDGSLIKIIMISPAGAEGLNLANTRQVHLLEPYWHEIRMLQMIGRAVRLCSHRDLPMKDRIVDVYRYKSVRKPKEGVITKQTTDQYIETLARNKDGLNQSFWKTLKEVAIDCNLYKNHNMLKEDFKCFQFDEPSLFDAQIGPAYKEDLEDDMRINNGSNSMNSITKRIKVKKIKAVKLLSKPEEEAKYSKEDYYWYYADTGVVYDFEFHYAIGKVGQDDDGIPLKLDKDTYIIDKLVPIPLLDSY
jgi:superfamily II DNA or RNA helicase